VQNGYQTSTIGQILLYSWGLIFAIGYGYMVLFTWLSYSPKFYAPSCGLEIFRNWNGLLAPWLLIFTSIHIIGMVLVLTWPAMRSGFMMPVDNLGLATHVVIEEDVSFDTDASMVDPDDFLTGLRRRLRRKAAQAGRRLQRAKCRTVTPVVVDSDGTRRIEYTCVRYVFSSNDGCFQPTGSAEFTALGVHEVLERGGLSEAEAKDRENLHHPHVHWYTGIDLREGRACLATNIATFQYFVTYSFFLTTVRTAYTIDGALSFADYVWIIMDVGIGIIMVYTMTQSLPTEKLCNYRPTATLLGPRTISAILFPCLSALLAKPWYVKLDPISEIHVPPKDWNLRGDNYDSPIGVIGLLLCLSNTAYINTYGGRFRRNILRNWKINIVYLVFLFGLGFALLSPPNPWNCIIRVNCDTPESLAAGHVPVVGAFSTGGIGGCFLGPQLILWQYEMDKAGYDTGYLIGRTSACHHPSTLMMSHPWPVPKFHNSDARDQTIATQPNFAGRSLSSISATSC